MNHILLISSAVLLLVCTALPHVAGLSLTNFSSSLNSPQLPSNTIYNQHDDVRCKCVCPSPQVVFKDSSPTQRRLYVGNSSPEQCNCYNVVQPHIDPKMIQLKDFCARCECKYQSRNTATIRWSVLFVVFVLSILCLYMLAYSLWENYRLNGSRGFPIPSFLKGSRLDNEPLSLN